MTDDIVLRSLGTDEIRAFSEPLSQAFAEEFAPGELDMYARLIEPDRSVSAFDGDQRVGSAAAYTFRLTVPGGEVGAAGITAIGVRPSHRRRGILRRMMTWLVDQALERGEPAAILWASEAAIYQRFGFGTGTFGSTFDVDRARAIFREPVDIGTVRMLDLDEAATVFPTVYEQVRRSLPGALDRSDVRWRENVLVDADWARGGNGPKYQVVLEVEGEPRAYAVYRIKDDWDDRGPKSTLLVMDLVALDASAEQALWQWLFSMDLVGTVKGWRGPVPHPLQQWLREPRRLGLTLGDALWLRILDVPAALAARTYARSGSLVLELTDSMLEANAGRWRLAVDDSTATVSRATAEPDLVLDVSALAAVYLGAYRFGDLAAAGSVRECQPGALHTADVLFTPPRSPWCSTMF